MFFHLFFTILWTRESFKYLLSIVKSTYKFVSIWSTYASNFIRCSFWHSIALELYEREKEISYFPIFCFNSGQDLITLHIFEKSTQLKLFLPFFLAAYIVSVSLFSLFYFTTFDHLSTTLICFSIYFLPFYEQIT